MPGCEKWFSTVMVWSFIMEELQIENSLEDYTEIRLVMENTFQIWDW